MASTPSASALSAVLRCRRNIWTAPSARLTGSTARDLPVKTASLWEAFARGERIVLGRLALSFSVPWKKRNAPNVCDGVSQPARAHIQGHAREPSPTVCTRPSLCAPRAKVVFVCETRGPGLCPRDTADRSAWINLTGACVCLTSLLSHLVLGRILLLIRTRSGQREELQGPGAAAAVDSGPGEGSVGGVQVTEDRPD